MPQRHWSMSLRCALLFSVEFERFSVMCLIGFGVRVLETPRWAQRFEFICDVNGPKLGDASQVSLRLQGRSVCNFTTSTPSECGRLPSHRDRRLMPQPLALGPCYDCPNLSSHRTAKKGCFKTAAPRPSPYLRLVKNITSLEQGSVRFMAV
jgi:hypothetical protein